MAAPKLIMYRALRSLGLQLSRLRDPYADAARLLRGERVTDVIDGGAYHGGAARRLATAFPGAIVHAFEPQRDTFQVLCRRLHGNERICLYETALSDRTGEAALHVNQQAFTTSLLTATAPNVMVPERTDSVAVVALDEWADKHAIKSVGFMKLDLQGHELAALRGGERLLRGGVKAMIIEVNFRRRYHGGALFHDVSQYVSDCGFELFRLYDVINDADGSWRLADALFVHESLRRT